MTRPLWQLLLLASDSESDVQLTCAECFALLEFDAECLAAGADPAEIRPSATRHLELCSNCITALDDRLERYSFVYSHMERVR